MSGRRRHSQGSGWFRQDLVPFLSIMLGLMSVMVLITISITVKKRQEMKDQVVVKLTGIPDEFVPLQIRCMAEGIAWQDDSGVWQEVSDVGLAFLASPGEDLATISVDTRRFYDWLREKAQANAELSYAGKQHTIILWVEPTGIQASDWVQIALDVRQIPLLVGKLPATEKDEIRAP